MKTINELKVGDYLVLDSEEREIPFLYIIKEEGKTIWKLQNEYGFRLVSVYKKDLKTKPDPESVQFRIPGDEELRKLLREGILDFVENEETEVEELQDLYTKILEIYENDRNS